MAITAAQFRLDFPAFVDPIAFPDSSVNFWIGVAGLLLLSNIWGTLLSVATELFVAHNLTLEKMERDTADFGGAPGIATGAIASKGVDKANVGYDTAGSLVENAGNWNMTTYGQRLAKLASYFGAGPVQL